MLRINGWYSRIVERGLEYVAICKGATSTSAGRGGASDFISAEMQHEAPTRGWVPGAGSGATDPFLPSVRSPLIWFRRTMLPYLMFLQAGEQTRIIDLG